MKKMKGVLYINMFAIISIIMLVAGCLKTNSVLVISSGLFAIAGAVYQIAYVYDKHKLCNLNNTKNIIDINKTKDL